jgi:hypothetical protein
MQDAIYLYEEHHKQQNYKVFMVEEDFASLDHLERVA